MLSTQEGCCLRTASGCQARLQKEASLLNGKTVEQLITAYVRYLGEYAGCKESTRANEQQRMRHFFGSTASEMRLSMLTEQRAEQMYPSHTQRLGYNTGQALSPTTHRGICVQ